MERLMGPSAFWTPLSDELPFPVTDPMILVGDSHFPLDAHSARGRARTARRRATESRLLH
jgi:hypothetical protein